MIKRICKTCGKIFFNYPSSRKKSYCSKECFGISRKNCIPWNKGKKFIHSGSFPKGKKHPDWRGGKMHHPSGYISIYKPNHPFANQKYVMEHRLIMERHLGRYLKPTEIVHHINGNTSDNRLKNLMLFKNHSEHHKFHWKLKKQKSYLLSPCCGIRIHPPKTG